MPLTKLGLRALRVVASVAIVCAIVAVEFHFHGLRNSTVTYSLLLAILFFAVRWDRAGNDRRVGCGGPGFPLLLSAAGGTFKVEDPQSYVAVAGFLITAIVVSQTALKARRRAAEALERKRETERLYELGQVMLASENLETTVYLAINQTIRIFGVSGTAFHVRSTGAIHRAGDSSAIADDDLRAVSASRTVRTDPFQRVAMVPIVVGEELAGSFAVCGGAVSETVLRSMASLLSVVLERGQAADKLVLANRELEQRHHQVEQQKQVSESLLLNILPGEVADELRSKGMVSPKYFEDVTILFTDFVGFTLSTEKLAAEELVEMLHDYFTAFDQIVARYRLEKLKTIGDSYMCISGLPTRNPAHPVDTVLAAFEMLHAVEERASRGRAAGWKVRIGIHTGPVIAGVVGINKFAFDIWGDTVNYSSRMESSSEANRINLSERTYSRVKDFLACEPRGKVLDQGQTGAGHVFCGGNSAEPAERFQPNAASCVRAPV